MLAGDFWVANQPVSQSQRRGGLEKITDTLDLLRCHAWPDSLQFLKIVLLVCLLITSEHVKNCFLLIERGSPSNARLSRTSNLGRVVEFFDFLASLVYVAAIRKALYVRPQA